MSEQPETAGFEYRCKRCGAVDRNPHTSILHAQHILIGFMTGDDSYQKRLGGIPVTLVDIHFCPDGGQGIAELIGYRKEIK